LAWELPRPAGPETHYLARRPEVCGAISCEADTLHAMGEGYEVGFVLLPGAGVGTWTWDRVITELDAPPLALPIPRRGLADGERRRVTLASAADESDLPTGRPPNPLPAARRRYLPSYQLVSASAPVLDSVRCTWLSCPGIEQGTMSSARTTSTLSGRQQRSFQMIS
jgi:hypothetical protein